jgi:hypothetical protein
MSGRGYATIAVHDLLVDLCAARVKHQMTISLFLFVCGVSPRKCWIVLKTSTWVAIAKCAGLTWCVEIRLNGDFVGEIPG